MPSRVWVHERACLAHIQHLLLVVDRFIRDLLALRIRCGGCDRARLAVNRNNDPASQRWLATFLVS